MLGELLSSKFEYAHMDGERFLDAPAIARWVKNAEAYYRAMYYGAPSSWNLRDAHMFETLNSHIGDARGHDRDGLHSLPNVWSQPLRR